VFAQSVNKDKSITGVKPDPIKALEEEEKRVKNPALRNALMQLREEFKAEKQEVHNQYKAKIKPIKIERDNNISDLKNVFLERRKMLFEQYGVEPGNKPTKIKNKKDKKTRHSVQPAYKPAKPMKKPVPNKTIPAEPVKAVPEKK